MRREELNMFLDGLLSLSTDQSKDSRKLLIELAFVSSSYAELLAEWLSYHDFWKDKILEVKTWMGLSYFQLMTLFSCSHRDVGRLLRTKRAQLLKPYPSREQPVEEQDKEGISCFMLEQHLSSWIDGEWETYSEVSKIKAHLEVCSGCQSRLQEYRELHQKVLNSRQMYEPISRSEWDQTLEELDQLKSRRRFRYAMSFFFILVTLAGIFFIIQSQPEKMPNIYEIKNTNTE